MSDDTIHTAVAGDRNILWGMAVTGRSALEHASKPLGINVLSSDFTQADQDRLQRSWDHPLLAYVRFYPIENEALRPFRSTGYLKSKAAYSRYFLGRIEGVDRLVYLDTDLLVLRDLKEAAQFDLEGRGLAAVRDISARQNPVNEALRLRLRLRDEANYFNSGFLIIDLERWRATNVQQRLIDISIRDFDLLDSQDQDALNILFEDDVALIDVSWNTSQYEAQADISNAIVHLIGTVKPWHPDYDYHFRDLFYHWLDRTAYAGQRPKSKDSLSAALTKLSRKIPTRDMLVGKLRRTFTS